MFAKFVAKFGRRIVMWAVVAISSALARKAMDAWADRGHQTDRGQQADPAVTPTA